MNKSNNQSVALDNNCPTLSITLWEQNNINLLNGFNSQTSANATLVHKTNFYDLDDAWEWSFYKKAEKTLSQLSSGKEVYNLLGFYRGGDYFPEKGFIYCSSSELREVYPIGTNEAVLKLYTSWKTSFEKIGFYSGLPDEFNRYWVEEESLIQDKFPDKWEKINHLCLERIKELAWKGKTKDYKSAWVFHKYRDGKLTEIINNSILSDTCFYYSSEIFYHRFSSPFMYISSKERKEYDDRFWNDNY